MQVAENGNTQQAAHNYSNRVNVSLLSDISSLLHRIDMFLCSRFQNILDGLASKNHETEFLTSTGAVVQAVVRHDDGLHAQSDPRKWGYAAGY